MSFSVKTGCVFLPDNFGGAFFLPSLTIYLVYNEVQYQTMAVYICTSVRIDYTEYTLHIRCMPFVGYSLYTINIVEVLGKTIRRTEMIDHSFERKL